MKKYLSAWLLVTLLATLLAACGDNTATTAPVATTVATTTAASAATTAASATTASGAATTAAGAATTAAAGAASADYNKIIEDSKKESNGLLIYSIMDEKNWAPVIKGFNAKYPWIKVQPLNLGSYEVFERYYSESASNARTGDMIITSSPDAWQEFIAKGELNVYKSTEDAKVPDWTKLAPGIYTVSTDPMVITWNKALVKDPPKTMADLAALIQKNPSAFQGKVTSYDAEKNATGFAAFWFWIKKNGEKGWKELETIGQSKIAARTSSGPMIDANLSGENSLGFFVSLINVIPKFPQAEPVLGWSTIGDGTPLIVRGMGITKKAASPNSSKLMMDYILSAEGQIAFAEGGLTAYRADVADKAKLHLSTVEKQIGADNLIPFSFDPDLRDQAKKDAFLARWKKTFGR